MKKAMIVGSVFLFFSFGLAAAAPVAKHLIDSVPGEAVLIHLDDWFTSHPGKVGDSRGDMVFQSPRSSVSLTTNKDTKGLGRHLHTTVDEIIYVYKGAGEMYINGKWVPVKAGDFHVCPRGVTHGTRAASGGELIYISIFTPPQPKGGNDRVMVDD
ncbi:MAG: cupin domain-containing protein [Syntrophorhabdales bacterium]|jgi:quercetin dioxygenase-like cupin family protein